MGETISPEFPFDSRFIEVNGFKMHYVEAGEGHPILLLHGNPTSSYLWRNVIPHLSGLGRCIAPDLIGFGKSDQPDISYRVYDHAKNIEAFVQAMDLKTLTLVLHDWGGFIGLSYAAKYPANVRAITLMEAVIRPMRSTDRSETFNQTFGMLRSEAGQKKVLEENFFVERILPGSIIRKLTDEEMAVYRAPFTTEQSRRPTWVFPNEIPLDGHPSDVHGDLWEMGDKVAGAKIPTLLLTFEPGAIIGPVEIAWCMDTFPNLTVEHLGAGIHFVQEDQPEAIGKTIAGWLNNQEANG